MAGFDPVIPPGGEGKVTATLSTNRYVGAVSKSISVYSNDPNNASTLLRLGGTVLVPIEVRPANHVQFTGRVGAVQPQELLIVARKGEPFDILEVKNQSQHLRFAVEPAPEAAQARAGGGKAPARAPADGAVAGGQAAYRARLSLSKDIPIGRLSEVILLETNHPEEPRLEIRVSGHIEGDVGVHPEALYFRRPRPGETAPAKQELRLTGRSEGGLEILGVECTSPDFVPSLHVETEGLEYRIEVERSEGGAPRATATLRIRTNAGLVEVPIAAY